jgi:sucrose-6-phosphate hydrolase SacC (GH32 family)
VAAEPGCQELGIPSDPSGCLVAVFTQHQLQLPVGQPLIRQQQSLAVSQDGGQSWKLYPSNPVLPNPNPRNHNFRDPRVFRFTDVERNDSFWVMAVAAGSCIKFFRSDNLRMQCCPLP